MKIIVSISTLFIVTSLLVSCSQPSGTTPSLGGMKPPTSRTPSPGRIQATSLMDSSRMMAPSAQ